MNSKKVKTSKNKKDIKELWGEEDKEVEDHKLMELEKSILASNGTRWTSSNGEVIITSDNDWRPDLDCATYKQKIYEEVSLLQHKCDSLTEHVIAVTSEQEVIKAILLETNVMLKKLSAQVSEIQKRQQQ